MRPIRHLSRICMLPKFITPIGPGWRKYEFENPLKISPPPVDSLARFALEALWETGPWYSSRRRSAGRVLTGEQSFRAEVMFAEASYG
jgi:hypothetical protein